MTKNKNYYDILGLTKNASEEEIKNAYRKLALKYHADRYASKPESEKKIAEEKMKEINKAYGVLSDSEKRQKYDRYGSEESFFQPGAEGFTSFGNSSSFVDNIFQSFRSFGFDFGQERGYERTKTRTANQEFTPQPGNDVVVTLPLTFKESVLGAKKKISLNLEKACSNCHQSGAQTPTDIIECSTCRGYGIVNTTTRTILGNFQSQSTCPTCHGQGRKIRKKCNHCLGKKFVVRKDIIEINIPRGIQPGQKIRYPGKGNDGLYGGEQGDLYLTIKVLENPYFQRKNNDIHVSLPISFLDAVLGGQVETITLEGVEKISVPPGTQNGTYLLLANRGCYLGVNKSSRGDLYVWLQIKVPKRIARETEEMLRGLQKKTSWNPNREFIEKYSQSSEN